MSTAVLERVKNYLPQAWIALGFLTAVFMTVGVWMVMYIALHPDARYAGMLLEAIIKPLLAAPFLYFLLFRPISLKFIEFSAARLHAKIEWSPGWMVFVVLATVLATSSLWLLVFFIVMQPMSDLSSMLLESSVKPVLASPLFYFLLFRPLVMKLLRYSNAQTKKAVLSLKRTPAMQPRVSADAGKALSPVRLLTVLAISVFVVETLVMKLLELLPAMPGWVEDTLDASILVIMLFPVFYFALFRPLQRTVQRLIVLDEAHRANLARLNAMLDNLPYLAWLKDAEGRYLAVNEPFAQASGKRVAADVIGKLSTQVCPEWMLERYFDDDLSVMASGRQSQAEVTVHEQGEDRWLEVFRNPVLDADGRVIGITGFSRDITDRKRAEEKLRLTAKIVESSHSAIFVTDPQSNIISVNPAFTRITGYSEQEVAGKTPRMLNSNIQDKNFYRAMWKRLSEQGYWTGELWNRKKNGELFAGHVSISALQDDQGNVAQYVCVTSDITEQLVAEEKLRLTAKVVESSHDSIMITDITGTIISVNPAFTEITGYSAEEAIGKNPRILKSGKQNEEFYDEMWTSLRKNGYWAGEVWNRRKDGGSYAGRLSITSLRDDAGKVTHFVGVTSDITEFKMAQERVRHLAFYDQLTGLPNATLMRDRANQLIVSSQRDRRGFALLSIDLDNFKNVNDSLGHHIGDLLLQTVSGRLRSAVREMDTVARMGGDEFVVLLPEVDAEGAQRVARKIIGQVTNPYGVEVQKISITTSIGIALFPVHGDDVEVLMKNAELALYQAKRKGKNDFAFFVNEMNEMAISRMQMENDLRRALLNEDLVLYYQPQISLVTRKVVGMEALVRWPHPQLKMIPPDQFIPIAEESDLIIELGEWAIHEACRQVRQWQRSGLSVLPVAVNVSARQMRQQDFHESVSAALRKTGLAPKFLELELTERAVMADVDETVKMMQRIGKLGVKFAVDDFGTGYSSLSYLRHLPLDKLKIDKSFVNDIAIDEGDREISNTIIQLAHSLKLSVVAEGVETDQQMSILLGQGCDTAQGYLFSRPLPPNDLAAFLHAAQAI